MHVTRSVHIFGLKGLVNRKFETHLGLFSYSYLGAFTFLWKKQPAFNVRISAGCILRFPKTASAFPPRVNSFGVLKKSTPLGGTRVALMNVMSISWYVMLIVTPMRFPYSNKSIHYLNQDKHIY